MATLVCDCTVVHTVPCLLAGQFTTTITTGSVFVGWGWVGGWVGWVGLTVRM